MRLLLIIISALLSIIDVLGQNFVPNGSFELYPLCPTSRNDGRKCFNWDAPTLGTSDYFNTCATNASNVDVPNNFAGSQMPRTGNAYTGLYASLNFVPPFLEYREYMQVTLDSLLIAGGIYTFEMWVSLADNSNFASNKIGAHISAIKPTSNNDTYLNVIPQIISPAYIIDKVGWTKITGVYIATGGERYITIGVFEPAATNTRIAVSGGSGGSNYNGVSYYYIDDVSLTRACDLPDTLLAPDIYECVTSFPSVTLSAAGPGARAYLWNTGATTPTITVNQAGTYFVKVNTPFCTRYDTIKIEYPLIPVVDLGSDTSFCNNAPFSLELNAQNTGAFYNWSTGAFTQKITVTQQGKYHVSISKNGCTFYDSLTVSVDTLPYLDLGANDTLCEGMEKQLNAYSPNVTYLWQDGSIEPSYTATTSGKYSVLVKSGVCMARDSVDLVFEPKPNLDLGPNTAYCFQQPVTLSSNIIGDSYLWQDGSTQSSFIATQAGIYRMELIKGKCTVRDSIELRQKIIPTLNLGADTKICKEAALSINLTNIAKSAIWNDASTELNKELKAPGIFYVSILNNDDCSAIDTIKLDTFTSPTVTLGNDSFICEDSYLRLDPGVYNNYNWQDGSNSRIFNATIAGIYFVSIKDENSCNASDTIALTVKNKPAISMLKLLRICNPDTLITPKGLFKNYLWQDGSTDTSFRVMEYGVFTFTGTDSNNCANIASLEVTNNCPPNIFVPNAFTPQDNDGINDFFIPVTRNVRDIEFKVFNRWGELLFQTQKLGEGWDGTFLNKPATSDVYVYTIKFEAFSGETGTRKGNVTLLR